MRAPEFMTTEVITTTPDETVRAAARKVLEHRVAALPVVDDEHRLVGIVSELDLLRERVAPDPRAHARPVVEPTSPAPRLVADIMTREVYALHDAADESQFAQLMADTGVKSIPVVRGELLVGIVGRRDLLRLLDRDDAAVRTHVADLLAAESASTGDWQVQVEDGQVTLTAGARPVPDSAGEVALALARTVPGVVRVRLGPDANASPCRDGS